METLLPCPFCGETDIMICEFPQGRVGNGVVFSAGCKNEDCMGYLSMTQFDRRSDAVAAWNKRSPK